MPIKPGDHHGTVQGVHLDPETGDLTTTIEVEGETFTHTTPGAPLDPGVEDDWDEETDGPRHDDWIHTAYERQAEKPWSDPDSDPLGDVSRAALSAFERGVVR